MKPFQTRWTNDDHEEDLPTRFDRALRLAGADRPALLRALIREWTLEVERRHGDPLVRAAAKKAAKPHK